MNTEAGHFRTPRKALGFSLVMEPASVASGEPMLTTVTSSDDELGMLHSLCDSNLLDELPKTLARRCQAIVASSMYRPRLGGADRHLPCSRRRGCHVRDRVHKSCNHVSKGQLSGPAATACFHVLFRSTCRLVVDEGLDGGGSVAPLSARLLRRVILPVTFKI